MNVLLFLAAIAASAQAEQTLIQPQTNTFNSSFTLTPAQIAAANLSTATAHNVEIALRRERTNNAGSLTQNDPFYALPANLSLSSHPPPGTLLKVEQHTNTTLYTLPPTTSLSRFLYVTQTLNGTRAPASAYVLWPFTPRRHRNGTIPQTYPTIGFAHGTSGPTPACAPSHLRNLWDDFHGPFALAQAGHAVVAPDYLGLGVRVRGLVSPYFVFPSQANDVFHAVAAVQRHWKAQLSAEFVVMGQSQGGGAAWAAAQRQAQTPVEGYLGAVAASPFTDVRADLAGEDAGQVNLRVAAVAQGLGSVRPGFRPGEWLTEAGVARMELMLEIQACGDAGAELFDPEEGVEFVRPGWNETESARWWAGVSANGGKAVSGPMLVLQGSEDGNAIEEVTSAAVRETCQMFPETELQYSVYDGVGHAPIIYAAQGQWQSWIGDRFDGIDVGSEGKCKMEIVKAGKGSENTVKDENWFIEYDLSSG